MTIGKATALTASLIGAMALGVLIGPWITDRDRTTTPAPAVTAPAQAPAESTAMKPAAASRVETRAERTVRTYQATMSASAPQLHERLQPVLNKGARMDVAAKGFRDAEQFATVAHAARNTGVPFMVLKHRVLNEKQSLAEALRASKPGVDAAKEVSRARREARADLAEIAGA